MHKMFIKKKNIGKANRGEIHHWKPVARSETPTKRALRVACRNFGLIFTLFLPPSSRCWLFFFV